MKFYTDDAQVSGGVTANSMAVTTVKNQED